ncbi:MAG: type III restriction enzyme [Desulfobacteraceae bacterium Eth-SRB1]|nr:MAG: type III restriction enzyme [Desulfobacteraceae bacterium Eth-SRB1]
MKLHFDPNQQYQLDAVKSIVDIFEGQPLSQGNFGFSTYENGQLFNENGVGNQIDISRERILSNLQKIQKKNGLNNISEKLDGMHFSVEMETGTGKTYVYIRTIYELNKKYGFKKFVIVVPSVAIREGVLKNLEITFDHFQNLYDRSPVNYDVYDSGKISSLRGFASNNAIQILVINIDSFAKDENVINRTNDKLTGKKPIEFIQSTKPVVIVDEPQNMETGIRKKAIENLNYSCTLRYSATHINQYNLIYSLDPVKAYDLGLVKQIEVDSIITENDFNDAFVRLEKVSATKTRTSARLSIDVNTNDGVKRKTIAAKVGDDLYKLSKSREIYKQGYIINGIDVESEFISMSNGEDLFVGDSQGGMTDEVIKFQIEKTVKEHFIKEKKYKDKGIKVLSLFFIDRVANYRKYDENGNLVHGKFAKWFKESFKAISSKSAYKGLIPFSVDDVHNGYFSQDKKGKFKDTQKAAKSRADIDIFKLIMKDKERLLSADEPLRFIFSHSALREGWDNPNVFQICTLNETRSDLKKRQEIGRGMRLAVDRSGLRIQNPVINKLTVIANESYEDFAKQLQNEIENECGVSFKGRIKNRKKRKKVKYRKGFELDENFKKLWDKIKHHTKYKVIYETGALVNKAARAIRNMPEIKKAVIKSTKSSVKFDEGGIVSDVVASYSTIRDKTFQIPDVPAYIQSRTGLTRSTILQILIESGRLDDVLINPQLFLDSAVVKIKEALNELIIDGIKYEKIGNVEYEMRLFEDYEIHVNDMTFYISQKEKTIFSNMVPLDSHVEYRFAKECETREDVQFYFKLPFWFKIKTPIGNYTPDWALIKKNEKTVYFVAETKSENQELKESEKRKIKCGKAHFDEFEDVAYRQVVKVSDLD